MTDQASNILSGDGAAESAEKSKAQSIAFEDAALIDRCRKGDVSAFGGLVVKYRDRVYNLILRMCGRPADAEELAQETFLKALERIHQFRGNSRFYTWLFRIAANLTISHRRRAARVKFHSMTRQADDDHTQAEALTAMVAERRNPRPDDAAMAAERSRRVVEALEELDDEFRLVVLLRDVEDMDYAGIGQVLGVPVGTVKSRLHRARSVLKGKLADLIA